MPSPLLLLGLGLVLIGITWIGYTLARLRGRTRVSGTVSAYKEASNVALADSMNVMIIQYTGLDGKKTNTTSKPRASIFWHDVGSSISVYLSKTQSPIIGGFAELWLMPLAVLGVGILCSALSRT